MKRTFNWITGTMLVALIFVTTAGQKAQAQNVSVSYQSFYDDLSPYGQWVNDPQYGNVWVPSNEESDFRPYYTRGHWVMTDYGNTWASDEPWGWATYHYGRWTYNPYYGWVWIPGNEWAPAWVSWRYSNSYCGWAPLGPGISIGVSSYNCPSDWWVFLGPQHLYENNYHSYWNGPRNNTTYINQTTIINNTYVDNSTHVRYNYGPRASAITAVTHQPVQVYHVQAATRPGATQVGNKGVNIYRPQVNQGSLKTARPTNVMNAPKPVGRPQAVATIGTRAQPQFRTVVQKQTQAPAQVPARNNPAVNQNRNTPVQPHQPQNTQRPNVPNTRQQPVQAPQNVNRPQTQPQKQQPQRQQPQQPVRQQTQPQRQQPVQAPRPQQRPQQQAPRPMPQQRAPQQAPRPVPQQRTEAPRPAPQQHTEAPRQAPQQREAPAPQHEEPHGEGGRR